MRPFRFSKPKTPGYGIAADFYLSVLAGTARLPTPSELVNPRGEDGAVRGFLVPASPGADKEALGRPLERGAYGVFPPDRQTAVRLLVVSKEEAFFDPAPILRSPLAAELAEEARMRIAATWTLLQLSFISHHPMVQPALEFVCALARRAAQLTEGVVADPLAERYLLPDDLLQAGGPTVSATAHVSVRTHQEAAGLRLGTRGMRKFAMEELELSEVPESLSGVAASLLLAVCQQRLDGRTLDLGDRVGAPSCPLQVAPGGLDRARWEGVPCWELIPAATGATVAQALEALAGERA